MKIFLDVDGVFADFDGMIDKLGLPQHSNKIWNTISKIPNFFNTLDVLTQNLEIIQLVKDHSCAFLTALPQPTGTLVTADTDKRVWIYNNVSKTIPVYTVVGGKNKVKWLESNPGSILIDDYKRNIDAWNEAGGIGILFRNMDTLKKDLIKHGVI